MAMLAALKHQAGRLPDLERELRRDQAIGAAPNPVGTEIFAAHVTPSDDPGFLASGGETRPNAPHRSVQGRYNASGG